MAAQKAGMEAPGNGGHGAARRVFRLLVSLSPRRRRSGKGGCNGLERPRVNRDLYRPVWGDGVTLVRSHGDSRLRREGVPTDFGEHQADGPAKGTADGLADADHTDELHISRLHADFRLATPQVHGEPEGVIEIEIPQEEVELFAPRPGVR